MLPDPKSKRAALAGSPNRKTNFNTADNATCTTDQQVLVDRQVRRLVRLYSMTAEVAATVAALAYAAGCPR